MFFLQIFCRIPQIDSADQNQVDLSTEKKRGEINESSKTNKRLENDK
jgi:hypothetical protein